MTASERVRMINSTNRVKQSTLFIQCSPSGLIVVNPLLPVFFLPPERGDRGYCRKMGEAKQCMECGGENHRRRKHFDEGRGSQNE